MWDKYTWFFFFFLKKINNLSFLLRVLFFMCIFFRGGWMRLVFNKSRERGGNNKRGKGVWYYIVLYNPSTLILSI